jgi:hypothetical protein
MKKILKWTTIALVVLIGLILLASKEYGKYLSALCTACHGTSLVAPVRGKYKQEDFVRAIRTGVLPNGTQIGRAMPPSIYGEMNDIELSALWLYMQNMSPT